MSRTLAHLTARLVMSSMLVLACACGNSEPPKPKASFTPGERASLEQVFNDIKQASRRGFETGDWSIMAKLYPEGSLACWDASGEEHRFGFLSMEPIPENARYQVGSLDNYIHGGVDISHMGGTHFMAIRYETSFASGCDLPAPKRWPERHIYLRKVGEQFIPVHPCPVQEQIEQKTIVRTWPMVSGAQAAQVVEAMSEQERRDLREKVRQDRFPLNAIISIQNRYGLSDEQASLVLDRVCAVTAQRER